jgi:hypothetical protein
MADWQITAATLRCDMIDKEVTLLVHKDWSVKCTGHARYARVSKESRRTSKRDKGNTGCQGTDCPLANDYLKKLQTEEKSRRT